MYGWDAPHYFTGMLNNYVDPDPFHSRRVPSLIETHCHGAYVHTECLSECSTEIAHVPHCKSPGLLCNIHCQLYLFSDHRFICCNLDEEWHLPNPDLHSERLLLTSITASINRSSFL